jgi:hypothetical protein
MGIDHLVAELKAAVADLDADRLDGRDALSLFGSYVVAERLCCSAKIALATRIESSRIWKESGHKNAATLIAETEGVGVGAARSTLETGKALVDAPKTTEALRDGKLSEPQVKELAGAVAVDPGQEAELVDAAQSGEPMVALRDRCRKTKTRAAGADPQGTLARIHADRHLSHWTDAEGAFCLKGRFTPDRGAQLLSVLEKATTDCFDRARTAGLRESRAAYGADALFELLCGELVCGELLCGSSSDDSGPKTGRRPRTVVNIRVDHEALLRGHARANELSVIDGIGEVPIPTIESLLPESFLKVLFYEAEELTRIAHPGRTLTEKLKTALANEYPTCVVPHCGATTFLEADHIQAFADHGPTTFNNLVHLCHFHHGLKTNAGYVVYQDEEGNWHFDPPPPFGQEPDLGGEPAGGLYDPIRDGHRANRTNSKPSDPPTGSGAGSRSGAEAGSDPQSPISNRRTGRRRPMKSRGDSKSDRDDDPGEPPPLFELGE